MKVGAAVARLDGSGDVVPQILPGGQAYVDDGVVGQVGGQDDGIDDRVTQRDESGAQAWAGRWCRTGPDRVGLDGQVPGPPAPGGCLAAAAGPRHAPSPLQTMTARTSSGIRVRPRSAGVTVPPIGDIMDV